MFLVSLARRTGETEVREGCRETPGRLCTGPPSSSPPFHQHLLSPFCGQGLCLLRDYRDEANTVPAPQQTGGIVRCDQYCDRGRPRRLWGAGWLKPDLEGGGKAFSSKACGTSPPGRSEHSWQTEQQGQRFRGIKGKPREALDWGVGGGGWGRGEKAAGGGR